MNTVLVDVADLKDPESGKTYRQLNNEKIHQIPLGSLVEVMDYDLETDSYVIDPDGFRLNVVEHTRDCDGTPLYNLSHMTVEDYNSSVNLMNRAVVHVDNLIFPGKFFAQKSYSGCNEECLKVLRVGPKVEV